jgi:hypothetical protein
LVDSDQFGCSIPSRYFEPTDAEKAKIQWFVENFDGDDEPWVKDMVELAKAVFEEVP